MFLDDQLYQTVKSFEIKKPEDFQSLVNELYRMVEDYYKSRLRSDMSFREGTAMLDKSFKLWDMFIAKLEKENWFLVSVLKDNHYKKVFLSNPKLREIYDKGL